MTESEQVSDHDNTEALFREARLIAAKAEHEAGGDLRLVKDHLAFEVAKLRAELEERNE